MNDSPLNSERTDVAGKRARDARGPGQPPPRGLNGRWVVEVPWPGRESDWWIPDTERDGKTELSFGSRIRAMAYRLLRYPDEGRVVQIQRWTPAETSVVPTTSEPPALVHATLEQATVAAEYWARAYGEPVVVDKNRHGQWQVLFNRPSPEPYECPFCLSNPCACTGYTRR